MSGFARPAKPALVALAAASLAIAAATWLPPPAKADGELNIYNWSDYIGENTVANFEKEYNVKVRYDTYDGNETLEAKLVVGTTGYDIVFPSSVFLRAPDQDRHLSEARQDRSSPTGATSTSGC